MYAWESFEDVKGNKKNIYEHIKEGMKLVKECEEKRCENLNLHNIKEIEKKMGFKHS